MTNRALCLASIVGVLVILTPVRSVVQAQDAASTKAAGAANAERDTLALLSPARVATLPERQRAEWSAYVKRSTDAQDKDRALMSAELATLGRPPCNVLRFSPRHSPTRRLHRPL